MQIHYNRHHHHHHVVASSSSPASPASPLSSSSYLSSLKNLFPIKRGRQRWEATEHRAANTTEEDNRENNESVGAARTYGKLASVKRGGGAWRVNITSAYLASSSPSPLHSRFKDEQELPMASSRCAPRGFIAYKPLWWSCLPTHPPTPFSVIMRSSQSAQYYYVLLVGQEKVLVFIFHFPWSLTVQPPSSPPPSSRQGYCGRVPDMLNIIP